MVSKEKIEQINFLLDDLIEDSTVPRNIRRSAKDIREFLNDKNRDIDVTIADAQNKLDELANDPNIPSHGRTRIWQLMSAFELLK